MFCVSLISSFFFFNDTATTEIYTLSLHDALPISEEEAAVRGIRREVDEPTDVLVTEVVNLGVHAPVERPDRDRKSTRLNSSHLVISYAVFCLKKKKNTNQNTT